MSIAIANGRIYRCGGIAAGNIEAHSATAGITGAGDSVIAAYRSVNTGAGNALVYRTGVAVID